MSVENWEWFGQAGHFCASHNCLYHLHTHVGGGEGRPYRYCVSTVGEYHLMGYKEGKHPIEDATPMGASNKLYESMVFRLDRWGKSIAKHTELEVRRTTTREDAAVIHRALCLEYDVKDTEERQVRRGRARQAEERQDSAGPF